MIGPRTNSNRRQFLAATGSLFLLAGCIDTGPDESPPTTLDEFRSVDASEVPLVVDARPSLSSSGEGVYVAIGT